MSNLTATTTRDMNTRSAQASRADTVKNVSELIGRTFLAVLFLLSDSYACFRTQGIRIWNDLSNCEKDGAASDLGTSGWISISI